MSKAAESVPNITDKFQNIRHIRKVTMSSSRRDILHLLSTLKAKGCLHHAPAFLSDALENLFKRRANSLLLMIGMVADYKSY